MSSRETVLITGAAGFLGAEVVRQLRRAGYPVITTDLRGDVDRAGDLADAGFVAELPDVGIVIHAAAVQYVTPTLPFFRRGRWFERNNVEAARNLATHYSGRVDYFLQVGTSMMYNQTGLPFHETLSPLKGTGVYSRSKLASVRLAQAMKNPVGVMIPCIIGGPGREGLFIGFIKTMTRWRFAIQPGSCRHPIHMVHVEDAASLIHCMAARKAVGFYNCAGPEPLSISQWIEVIRDELRLVNIRKVRIPYPFLRFMAWATKYRILAREQIVMLGQAHVLSIETSLALGWRPRHSNERIVRDIARYVTGVH
jgi:nucleoside-diphosphate-sugar epimerase